MKQDPIIQEIRAVRKKIEKECGGTAEGYARHLRSIEGRHVSRLVRFLPKPVMGEIGHVAETGGCGYGVAETPSRKRGASRHKE